MANQVNVLTEEFLMDLFYSCMNDERVLAVVAEHIKKEYLPDRDFIRLFTALTSYYKDNSTIPSYGMLKQTVSLNRSVVELLEDIYDTASIVDTEQLLKQIEKYIKHVKFKQIYKEVGELYNQSKHQEAEDKLADYTTWAKDFSLTDGGFVDIIGTFSSRFKQNRQKHNATSKKSLVNRFYIDELDVMNEGRDLRGQLTCFLAATGVGKSHAARYIGKSACQIDGHNVLHIQLEGSENEITNAYSASLVACNVLRYETGTIRDSDIAKMEQMLESVSGKIFVKCYPKFNCHVSTVDIKNAISDFKKKYGIKPDIIIIDSMDLLTDSSGRKYGENGERHKRIAVANDLKDIAGDEDVWVVVTYQSTIENREWLNDENNVLTEYNSAEAKGLARPLTHLISLNQSDHEREEEVMRLHVAKSRFFKKGKTFKIATSYSNEQFYDQVRTMRLTKLN